MHAASLLLGIFTAVSVSAGNWPQFRGTQAAGVDTSGAAPTRWDVDKRDNIRWSTPIPGLGHASPIIWNDRVYVATAVRPGEAELKVGLYGDITSANDQEPHQRRLLPLDKAPRKIAWDKLCSQASSRAKRHPPSSPCSSTPAT